MLEGSRRGIIPLGLVLALRLDWLLHCNCRAAAHEGIIYLVPDHKQGDISTWIQSAPTVGFPCRDSTRLCARIPQVTARRGTWKRRIDLGL